MVIGVMRYVQHWLTALKNTTNREDRNVRWLIKSPRSVHDT